MSFRSNNQQLLLSLQGIDFNSKSELELQELFQATLKSKMHGICFSAYGEGQEPGDILTEEQIYRRMKIIAPYTKWIRSFSCKEGNELIPQVAKKLGVKTLVGAWLSDDKEANQEEMDNLIQLVNDGFVDVAAVGNEVLYREELTEEELISCIQYVKDNITVDVPVGYVDAYYEFTNRPRITELCDVILTNCYPFWEGCTFEYSNIYMKQMYYQAKEAGKGKRVIITETGWPSQGSSIGGAQPSYDSALQYFINTQIWSQNENIETFYFSSFDESWKVGDEGDVGAFWGIWDKNENLKFQNLILEPKEESNIELEEPKKKILKVKEESKPQSQRKETLL
jgi:exo-beta-1,3-glucanase (GH17 family)